MRAVLFALLLAVPALARAETTTDTPAPAAPAKVPVPPYRLVRILPDTNQALLLDKKHGKHVVVDVGDQVGPYDVIEIDEDQVVLGDSGREFVLVAGEAPTARLADPYPMPDPAPVPAPAPAATELLDPYPAGTLDPYGTDGVHTVEAPDPAPKVAPPAPTPAPDPAPVPAPAPAAAPAPPPDPTSFSIPKKQLSSALSDFAQIGKDVQMSLVADGVLLVHVAPTSFFFHQGLRDGDIVRTVDGTAIHGMDDAAGVYAKLGKVKKFTVEITRAGAPVTLSYRITK